MADFTNIDGVYAKDIELRSGIDTLRTTVLSNTIKPLTVTKNDTYTAIPSSGTYGYSPIIVDVQEEPWTPLQDGYSNFWFELTNDTLSPWLNFSAKNNDAVIDWGDGSGEQSLDTLTPTHTYSKAGKYVVKCKGVTGIARINFPPYNGKYLSVLKAIELNSEINNIVAYAFYACTGIEHIVFNSNIELPKINSNIFQFCSNILSIDIPSGVTSIDAGALSSCLSMISATIPSTVTGLSSSAFSTCYSLPEITIPSGVTTIGNSAFSYCYSLATIHMLPTAPPTLGTNVFISLPNNFIIYVPVGTGDTYKSAAGWSTYADHILEEGQQPNRAMLAKFNSTNTDNEEMR